jgi:hypothetical protein
VERVGSVYEHLKDSCKLPNLPPTPTKAPPTRSKSLRIGKLGKNVVNTTLSNLEKNDVKIKKITFS